MKGKAHRFEDNVDTDMIIPARYLVTTDPAEMASHVVAVPKSTTIAPARKRSYAATALTMRSAPTSRGFS